MTDKKLLTVTLTYDQVKVLRKRMRRVLPGDTFRIDFTAVGPIQMTADHITLCEDEVAGSSR